MTDKLLGIKEVAELLGVSEWTLREWRQSKRADRPRSATLGRRVVYRESEVLAWIDARFEASA